MTFGRSTTRCAGSSAPALLGACCRATSRPGTRSTTRRGAGWRRAASRRWRTTSAPCCAWPRGAPPSRARPSSTAARCAPRPRAAAAPATTGPSGRRARKLHAAVDTLGHLLALHVTPADEQDRAQVGQLAAAVQEVTGEAVDLAYVDQGYTGEAPAEAAGPSGIALHVVRTPEAKRGFVLLPRRWVVERVRLGRPLPPPRPRLRATAADRRGPALRRLRHPHARQGRGRIRLGP